MSWSKAPAPPFVYFIRQKNAEGPVKIGCSRVPSNRLLTLSLWAPYPLYIAAAMPGDEKLEARFHQRFRDQHTHAEWFTPTGALDDTIAAVAAGTFDTASLPLVAGKLTGEWSDMRRDRLHLTRGVRRLAAQGVEVPASLTWPDDWRLMPDAAQRALLDDMRSFLSRYPAPMWTAAGQRRAATTPRLDA